MKQQRGPQDEVAKALARAGMTESRAKAQINEWLRREVDLGYRREFAAMLDRRFHARGAGLMAALDLHRAFRGRAQLDVRRWDTIAMAMAAWNVVLKEGYIAPGGHIARLAAIPVLERIADTYCNLKEQMDLRTLLTLFLLEYHGWDPLAKVGSGARQDIAMRVNAARRATLDEHQWDSAEHLDQVWRKWGVPFRLFLLTDRSDWADPTKLGSLPSDAPDAE